LPEEDGHASFPASARRTGRAVFPHPALGSGITRSAFDSAQAHDTEAAAHEDGQTTPRCTVEYTGSVSCPCAAFLAERFRFRYNAWFRERYQACANRSLPVLRWKRPKLGPLPSRQLCSFWRCKRYYRPIRHLASAPSLSDGVGPTIPCRTRLPVFHPWPSGRAVAITPAERSARFARSPTRFSLPRNLGGSASALSISRPARRSLALRPVHLQMVFHHLLSGGLRRSGCPLRRRRSCPVGAIVAGAGLAPAGHG